MINIETNKQYYYSYDFLQVKHLIKNKCSVIQVGIGEKNEDLWFKFIKTEQLKELVDNWRNKENKE